ncbi:MAG: transglutaminase domain-containing protein, partial [Spirochaetales bacterium]|nr:transglutaminase domain-containing protein [Spirochaetales bacterium]
MGIADPGNPRQTGYRILSFAIPLLLFIMLLMSCASVLSLFRPPTGQQSAQSPPQPQPDRYRNGKPDPRVTSVAIASTAPRGTEPDLAAALQRFTEVLTADEPDPFMKVKLMHDWIALSIDYDEEMAQQEFIRGQDLATVLRTRKAVCAGYARLFSAMSAAAGVENTLVSGRVRSIGIASSGDLTPHIWNLVRIGGRPYLVDVTFDAATIIRGRHVQSYSTDYLFAPPEQMRYTHLPDVAAYQLLQKPMDEKAFMSQPLITPTFFSLGLSIVSPASGDSPLSGTLRTTGICEIEIEAPPEIMLDGGLYRSDGREIQRAAIAHRLSPVRWRMQYAVPSSGLWHVMVFAAKPQEKKDALTMNGVLRFSLQASAGWPSSPAFPLTYALYSERPGEYL